MQMLRFDMAEATEFFAVFVQRSVVDVDRISQL